MISISTLYPSLLAFMPEIFWLASILVMLLFGLYFKGCHASFIGKMGAMIGLLALGLQHYVNCVITAPGSYFNGFIDSSNVITVLQTMIFISTSVALWQYASMQKTETLNRFEIPILMMLASFGMLVLVAAADFLTVYMGMEMQSLALYVLAASRHDQSKSTEAGLKYFSLGALASGIMLYGISLIYGYGNSTEFSQLAQSFSNIFMLPLGVTIGMVCVLAGLLFKAAAVPFHMWAPDVYEGSSTIITAFFAVVTKLAAFGILLRVLYEVFGGHPFAWQQILFLVASLTLLWGALGACMQQNIKRLLAYSSIGHAGFMMLGLLVGSKEGMIATLLYMAVYAIMSAGMFACLLRLERNGKLVEEWHELSGLLHVRPIEATVLIVLLFSMAGIPPLAGFFIKLEIFKAVAIAGLWPLVGVAVIASVISAYYYLKIVKQIVCDQPLPGMSVQGQFGLLLCGIVSMVLTITYILIPSTLLEPLKTLF